MRSRKAVALFLAICILMSGCTFTKNMDSEAITYEQFRSMVDKSRSEAFDQPDFAEYIERNRCPDEFRERTEQELSFEIQQTVGFRAPEVRLTPREIESDMDYLFNMLREDYGAYEFFGGDEVFLPAKARFVRELTAECTDGKITVLDFEAKLGKLLAELIHDRSFLVRDNAVMPEDKLYRVQNEYFSREGDDYFYFGKKVISVDGLPPETYIKPSVALNGAIVHSLWGVFPIGIDPTAKFLPIELEGGETMNLRWEAAYIDRWSNYSYGDSFRESQTVSRDGTNFSVPYIASSNLGRAGESFVRSADRPADEKALILDIRVCGGDDESYIRRWFAKYAGDAPEISEVLMHRSSPMNNIVLDDDREFGTYTSMTTGRSVQNNDRVLIVLVGGNRGAAELAHQLAKRVPNVIILGGVSSGAALTSDSVTRMLPASGSRITFGTTLRLAEGMFDESGSVTLYPDLYGNPGDAMVLAREMVRYYGLK